MNKVTTQVVQLFDIQGKLLASYETAHVVPMEDDEIHLIPNGDAVHIDRYIVKARSFTFKGSMQVVNLFVDLIPEET